MRILYSIVPLVVVLICLVGCSHKSHDSRLVEMATIVSEHPEEVLARLDSIEVTSLSGADRHFCDFLKVKARDKAYIRHTSDSLILDVIDYYRRHEKVRCPEALYYGGRVYSDMGDYPTALQYFHEALENMPADSKDYDLKCRILSQTSRLLNTLRLYKEAKPYIKESIAIRFEQKDTVGIVNDLQLLGGISLRADEYALAEMYFIDAWEMSKNLPDYYKAKSEMNLADIKYMIGKVDSALLMIRGVPERVHPVMRRAALDIACSIYYAKGLTDTAYMYAQELINSGDPDVRQIGYKMVLRPGCRKYIPQDTLFNYITDYRSCIETYLNHNEHLLALTQETQYNYQLHERERVRAETSNERLRGWLIAAVVFLLVLASIILYLKNRNKARIIQLQQALENIRQLKDELSQVNESVEEKSVETVLPEEVVEEPKVINLPVAHTNLSTDIHPSEHELRKKLIDELMSLSENNDGMITVPYKIRESGVLKQLQDMIDEGKILKSHDKFWNDIERIVLESSPSFKRRLNLLTYGKVSSVEYNTALLIKCGLKPSRMAQLLGKSNGAIVSRRETLSQKVFERKESIKHIDNIIRLL